MNQNLYHYQKQEIIIDKSSEAAMKFYEETVKAYFTHLAKTKIVEHLVDERTGERSDRNLMVHTDVTTEDKVGKLKIVSEENWEDVDGFVDHSYNLLCFRADENDPDNPDTWEYDSTESHYLDGIESAEGNTDLFDIDYIINAYREKGDVLKDSCRIRVVRGRDLTGDRGSRVFCWSSSMDGEAAEAANNTWSNNYGGAIYLNRSRDISLDELPDTKWTTVYPIFMLRRANGLYLDFEKRPHSVDGVPISPEIYEEFGEFPARLDELTELFFYDCEFTVDCDIMGIFHASDYSVDVSTCDYYEPVEITIENLITSMEYLREMISIVNENNSRFFERVNFNEDEMADGDEMVHFVQLFYSKDFALLEIFYDHRDRTLKYRLFDECFGK